VPRDPSIVGSMLAVVPLVGIAWHVDGTPSTVV
jgi:hypothetical protein